MSKINFNHPVTKSPLLASFLSLIFFGGGGQIYLGQTKKGMSIVLVTLFLTITVFITQQNSGLNFYFWVELLASWTITIVGMVDAYNLAKKKQDYGNLKEWDFFWKDSTEHHTQNEFDPKSLIETAPSKISIENSTNKRKKTANYTNRTLQAFLCHSSTDKKKVEFYYDRLKNDGVEAWLDKKNLLPGQRWQIEIPKAVRNSDVVIVFLSSQSVTKEGFVQKEIKIALDTADEKPEETIFIIPAKLENCEVPERLSAYQWVDLFEEDGYERLMKALQARASSLDLRTT